MQQSGGNPSTVVLEFPEAKTHLSSAYPAVGPDVKNAGAEFVNLPWDKAHVDGNLVSGPAWTAHVDWLTKFLKVLGTRIEP